MRLVIRIAGGDLYATSTWYNNRRGKGPSPVIEERGPLQGILDGWPGPGPEVLESAPHIIVFVSLRFSKALGSSRT